MITAFANDILKTSNDHKIKMFEKLIYILCCLTPSFCYYPIFKVANIDCACPNRYKTVLFKRSGGPNCSNYVKQENQNTYLLFHNETDWVISDDFETFSNENDPSCDIIEFNSLKTSSSYNLKSLELCHTTMGYEIVEGTSTSLVLDGDNCKSMLKKYKENIKAEDYLFYSITDHLTSNSDHWYTKCRFAYSATVKLKRLDSATLLVYHKDCDSDQQLK